jgi:hypothetical protein
MGLAGFWAQMSWEGLLADRFDSASAGNLRPWGKPELF